MTTAELVQQAAARLSEWAREMRPAGPERIEVRVARDDLQVAVHALAEPRWGYLSAITGLDTGPGKELEALYHFCQGAAVVTLRVRISREDPRLPSVTGLIPYAGLLELELSEMFGIQIGDVPVGEHTYLPDDWPAGAFPLRKDFDPTRLITGQPSNG